jgi:molybdopterin synthase sulfurtransferase
MAHSTPHTDKLISPVWLQNHPARDFLLFEVGNKTSIEYKQGHIPGAMYLDTNSLERPPLWNRLPDTELERALLAHEITHDKTVVLYGRGSAAAARVAVILLYAGVKNVGILDGGFGAWEMAGFPSETRENSPVPAPRFGITIPARPEIFVDTEKVKAILTDQNSVIVSVRSWAEYIGETSGYDFIEPKGRIAGAVWEHAGSDKDRMEHYHNPDGTARDLLEISKNWRRWGITPDKQVVFYCGTGWRASEAFFYAYVMGWPKISVYDGGWLEWSSNPANPIEVGIPERIF